MNDVKLAQLMYTLGEIAGAVFPDADIPVGVRATLFSRPYDGLRMMREFDNYRCIPSDRLFALLDRVPVEFQLPQRLTDDQTRSFWAGFLSEEV